MFSSESILCKPNRTNVVWCTPEPLYCAPLPLLSRERKEHVAFLRRMLDSEKNAFELNCDAAIAKKNIFVLNWLFKYLTLLLFKPPWNSVTALVTFLSGAERDIIG